MRWLPLLSLIGCGTPWEEFASGNWRLLTTSVQSNNSGNAKVDVHPHPGETNFLISFQPRLSFTGDVRESHLRFMQVDGDMPYRASTETSPSNVYSRSSAAFVSSATTLNWPIAASDGELSSSKHKFTAGIVDLSRQYTQGTVDVDVLLKADVDLRSGGLRINLVYGGETGADQEITSAVDEAVQIWRDIYASIGLQLDIETFTSPDGTLQAPGQGDALAYQMLADSTRFGAVNLLILEDIRGAPGALGFAGNIPGPLAATSQSAVVVNATLGAGTDGRFNPIEIALLGETMAHEVGHFLGLYHPVEASFTQWDALDDTPDCDNDASCQAQLGSNLMYPYPICDSNSCTPQQDLSPEQRGVANRYTGVL